MHNVGRIAERALVSKTIEFALNYFALTLVQDIAWRIVQRRKVLLVETVSIA